MSTYTQIVYHIVFSTKERVPCLLENKREELFRYIWGIVKNKQSYLLRINGVDDHLHILSSLHPSVSLADFVKEIKGGSAKWIKDKNHFPNFLYWQEGYSAFTHSIKDKERLIAYIKNQQRHHAKVSFRDELKALLLEHGVTIDERYLV